MTLGSSYLAKMTERRKIRKPSKGRLMRRFLKSDSRSVFRGIFTLAVGSAAGRFVGLLSIPIVTRIYSPEDFGVLSVFVAITGILAPLLSLSYSQALPLPRSETSALNLLAVSLMMVLNCGILISLLIWAAGPAIFKIFSVEILTPWWWLVVIATIGRALFETFTMWATRMRAYKIIASTSVWQSILGVTTKIFLGSLGFQTSGLIIGQIVSQTSGISALIRKFFATWCQNWGGVRLSRMRIVAWRFREFPIYRVPSQFIMVFGMQSPVLLFAAAYDASTAGHFGLAMTSLSLPLNIISVSAGRALYAEASTFHRADPGKVVRVATDVRIKLFLISIIPASILFFWGPFIFGSIFGQEWIEAGRFASALSFSLAFQFAAVPLVQLVNLISSQRFYLFLNMLRVLIVLSIFVIGWFVDATPFQLILVYSIVISVYYFVVSEIIIRMFNR